MAPKLTTLIEQTWYMAAETVAVSVADQSGTNTRTITDTGAWYRTRLVASGSTTGAMSSPHQLLAKFQTALNAGGVYYTVRYQEDGRIGITYSGALTSTITWGANGAKLRRLLGFSEDATTVIPTGTTTVATYHPCGSVLNHSLFGEGFTSESAVVAGATGADGRVYAVSAQASLVYWKRTLQWHPLTWGARTSEGVYSTPIYAGTSTSMPALTTLQAYYDPWTSCASAGGGIWSVHALVTTALNAPVAICPNAFQTVRTASSSEVFVGWITEETLAARRVAVDAIPLYPKMKHWRDFEVSATINLSVGSP